MLIDRIRKRLANRDLAGLLLICSICLLPARGQEPVSNAQAKTSALTFKSHDGHEMFGKLTLPSARGRYPVVIYVQTAEGMTVDVKRQKGRGETFNYFDLYRDKLPAMNVAFFSYEGRGIRLGDKPPRYETIDWNTYNTSSLENKVRDVLTAVELVKRQPGVDGSRIFLMGASEGTLLAAEAAARAPRQIRGLVLYAVLTSNMRETFKYIVTDGAFMSWQGYFDTDKDGKITPQEFEADPKKFREKTLKNAPFTAIDADRDGVFTVEDFRKFPNPLRDAADKENFEVLDQWAKTSAAVATPQGWFKDHFAHQTIWAFLSKLNLPVGLFQGGTDAMVPVAGVRVLEAQAKQAGKTKMEFHYFDGLDHSLNLGEYFSQGVLPAGHQAIFDFIRKQTEKK